MTVGATRILQIELNYGRHRDAVFEVPEEPRPVVVAGPNGAGKTTLLEGLVRGLCGFNRRKDAESDLLDARRDGLGACWCRLRVMDAEGRVLDLERDFEESTVRLVDAESGDTLFNGDANPGGDNEDTRAFRRYLKELLGFTGMGPYASTAFIAQGELIDTRLDQDLLRAATGGGGGVEPALSDIEKRHRKVTRRPLHENDRGGRKDRELEALEARLAELRDQLRETESLERQRRTVLDELEAAEASRDDAAGRRDRLRTAFAPLNAESRLESDVKHLDQLHDRLDAEARRLRDAVAAARGTESPGDADTPRYPDDFEAKVAAARELWAQRDKLEKRVRTMRQIRDEQAATAATVRPVALTAAAAALVLAVVAGSTGVTWLWALVALAAAAAAWLWLRRGTEPGVPEGLGDAESEAADVEARLEKISDTVPGEGRLTRESVELHLERFREQRTAAERKKKVREQLDRAADEAGELLREAADDEDQSVEVPDDPEALSGRLDDLSRRTVQAYAKKKLELEDKRQKVDLPEGVPRDAKRVERALHQAESEVDELTKKCDKLNRRLVQQATPSRSSTALRDEIVRTEDALHDVTQRAEALEEAWDLLRTAYETFRAGDESRLLSHVSGRLEALTGGDIGPVETDGELSDATVLLYGRRVRLDSPGLSYGERMAARLAIRLAATDFLGRGGIVPPLIVDEPFDDLDPERSKGAWKLLQTIARERQVIVASQNRLVLEWLGVKPDVRLER